MAGSPVGVFEITLEKTEALSERVAGNVNREKEVRCDGQKQRPKREDNTGFKDQLPRPFQAPAHVRMMGQMPVPPEFLRNTEEKRLISGKATVPKPLLEERQMNEVVGHRVAVPQKRESDEQDRRPTQQNNSMEQRKQHQKRIPVRVAQLGKPTATSLHSDRRHRRCCQR